MYIQDSNDSEAKNILKGIQEFIRWKYSLEYNFNDNDEIIIDNLFIPPLYSYLDVYKDTKKMLSINFHTGHFASSNHIIIKK